MKIPLKIRKKYAKYLNNDGFTMIEVILSFIVFCMLASYLPPLFSIILNMNAVENRTQRLEFELFISQLNSELQGCDFVDVNNGKLVLLSSGEQITFEKYGTYIRRLVQMRGHELILQNVQKVEFTKDQNSIFIKVVDKNNYVYMDQLFPFLQVVREG